MSKQTLEGQIPAPAGKIGFVEAQIRFICRHAWAVVLVMAIATAAVLPLVSKLKLRANFMDLLPADYPSIKALKELNSHVGGTSFLIGVIESPDETTAREAAQRFIQKAGSFKQIEYVDNRTNSPLFERNKLLFLKLESLQSLRQKIQDLISYQRRKNNPFFVDLLNEEAPVIDMKSLELEEKVYKIGGFAVKEKDSFMQVVLLKPKHPVSDFVHSRLLFDEVEAGFEEVRREFSKPVTLGLTGSYRTRYQEFFTIKHDLRVTGIIATVLLVLINVIGFRNLRSLVYAYLPLSVGVIWTWAFTEVSIGYLNLITAFLAAILFGMGGDYTFHILTSFEDDYRETGDVEKALIMTYKDLWIPLWSSMSTTAVVFYAMTFTKFEGFRHFGIIAGVGIFISFLIVLVLEPALIVLIEKYFPLRRKPLKDRVKVSRWGIRVTVILGILFSLFSLSQISRVKFNYNFTDLQPRNGEAMILAERIGEHFGVHLNPVVFMTPDRQTASQLAGEINRYIGTHPETLFHFASSLTLHVPRQQEEKIGVLKEIGQVLSSQERILGKLDGPMREKVESLRAHLDAAPYGIEDLPGGLKGQYEGKDGKISAVFIYPAVRILNGEYGKRFVKEARAFPVPPGVKLAGEPVIYADILNLIASDVPVALLVSTLVVFVLVFWHFKRLDHVLWVHVPFLVGVLWMIGMMGAAGVKFNFFNMVIVPSILGVGIDNGIYIFDRYTHRRTENFFETMHKSIKGVLLSSATNIAAFCSLMFSTHNGMASIGALGFFGFLSCLLASVFFVPALIEWFELRYAHLFRRNENSESRP